MISSMFLNGSDSPWNIKLSLHLYFFSPLTLTICMKQRLNRDQHCSTCRLGTLSSSTVFTYSSENSSSSTTSTGLSSSTDLVVEAEVGMEVVLEGETVVVGFVVGVFVVVVVVMVVVVVVGMVVDLALTFFFVVVEVVCVVLTAPDRRPLGKVSPVILLMKKISPSTHHSSTKAV